MKQVSHSCASAAKTCHSPRCRDTPHLFRTHGQTSIVRLLVSRTCLPWSCSQPFKEEVCAWIGKLATVSEAVEGWLAVQAMWSYMEAVFSGGDIVKQLPAEAKRFQNIDKGYMKVGSSAH